MDKLSQDILELKCDVLIPAAIVTVEKPDDPVVNVAPEAKSLTSSGLKIVNSDSSFEHLLKKAGHSLDLGSLDDEVFNQITSDDPNSIRSKAKQIMLQQFAHYKNGRLGVRPARDSKSSFV
mgnify:CR=1 FL=1